MGDVLKLTYSSSIDNLRPLNSSFDIGTMRICYPGANQNKTYFSKETLERSIPSMYNCPIVAHYERDGSIGGHDSEVIRDYDNELRLVNLTQPVGVVPESTNVRFETVEEDTGETHEYLTCDVILWKRQEAYKAIKENGITAQSMEVTVSDGARVGDVYVVNAFEFCAFALLGDVQPCFESASLMTYSSVNEEFKKEMSEMMEDLKRSFNELTTSGEVDRKSTKGGTEVLDDKNLVEETFSETEVIDEVESVEEEVFDAQESEAETVVEVEETVVEEQFALNSNLCEEIHTALAEKQINTEWGVAAQYCMVDYDVESSIVYAWDCNDWLLYGFDYSMNGDHVVINWDSRKRMKYVIAEFEEGDTQESPFAFASEKMTEAIKTANEATQDFETKYQQATEQIAAAETELEELRQFKADIETASDKAQRDELFAQFADLGEVEEFAELVANSAEYDLQTLEEKCFAIRGRSMKLNFSKNETRSPKLLLNPESKDDEKEPYGGVVKKFLHK